MKAFRVAITPAFAFLIASTALNSGTAAAKNFANPNSARSLLYGANSGNNSITVDDAVARGNTSPPYVIAVPKTGLRLSTPSYPDGQRSEDRAGNLSVSNGTSIRVFAHGARGNASPHRITTGPLTGIQNAIAATVDQYTGKLFGFNQLPPNTFFGASELLRFPPGANENNAPLAISQAEFGVANQIASDSTGRNIIEGCPVDAVYVHAHNASGNAHPLRVLAGLSRLRSGPTGICEGP